jgi:hypothetical protein
MTTKEDKAWDILANALEQIEDMGLTWGEWCDLETDFTEYLDTLHSRTSK